MAIVNGPPSVANFMFLLEFQFISGKYLDQEIQLSTSSFSFTIQTSLSAMVASCFPRRMLYVQTTLAGQALLMLLFLVSSIFHLWPLG